MLKLQNLISRRYWKSLLFGYFTRKDYQNIQNYCMFIGYQRSGHSYIGALIDAHPNSAIGMEVDALNLLELNYSRQQIYFCLVNNARIFTNVLNNVWTGYSYAVPGGFQGKYDSLLTIGDKKGGKSTLRIGDDPLLIDKLSNIVKVPIKIIHVIRNPYDNISTMCFRHKEKKNELTPEIFMDKINYYFKKVEINHRLRKNPKYSILDIYHEEFIDSPKKYLGKIIQFIGLPTNEEYLENCVNTTYKSPNKSRNKIEWPDDLKILVQSKIETYSFLNHYSFND